LPRGILNSTANLYKASSSMHRSFTGIFKLLIYE
jgi:hypothetical protein